MAADLALAEPIIIVDDAREDLVLLKRILRCCKILNPIIGCDNGASCLAALDRALATIPPVIVMVDLIMAPMSGLAVIRELDARGVTKSVPVVMLSGVRDIHAVRDGYQLGAQTFLVKPVNEEDIRQVVSSVARICVEDVTGGYLLKRASCPPSERTTETSFFRKAGLTAFPA